MRGVVVRRNKRQKKGETKRPPPPHRTAGTTTRKKRGPSEGNSEGQERPSAHTPHPLPHLRAATAQTGKPGEQNPLSAVRLRVELLPYAGHVFPRRRGGESRRSLRLCGEPESHSATVRKRRGRRGGDEVGPQRCPCHKSSPLSLSVNVLPLVSSCFLSALQLTRSESDFSNIVGPCSAGSGRLGVCGGAAGPVRTTVRGCPCIRPLGAWCNLVSLAVVRCRHGTNSKLVRVFHGVRIPLARETPRSRYARDWNDRGAA